MKQKHTRRALKKEVFFFDKVLIQAFPRLAIIEAPLDKIAFDGGATVRFRFSPFQLHVVVVIDHDREGSWLTRHLCKRRKRMVTNLLFQDQHKLTQMSVAKAY